MVRDKTALQPQRTQPPLALPASDVTPSVSQRLFSPPGALVSPCCPVLDDPHDLGADGFWKGWPRLNHGLQCGILGQGVLLQCPRFCPRDFGILRFSREFRASASRLEIRCRASRCGFDSRALRLSERGPKPLRDKGFRVSWKGRTFTRRPTRLRDTRGQEKPRNPVN